MIISCSPNKEYTAIIIDASSSYYYWFKQQFNIAAGRSDLTV